MKFALAFLFTLFSIITFSQSQPGNERFIEVSGEGEIKVDPNLIYLSIHLQEFKKDGKIVKLETLEASLRQVMQAVGIPVENLKVYATSGRQYDVKKAQSNLMIGKRYSLKIDDIDLINPLLSALVEVDILSVSVREVTHTEIEKFSADTRLKAILAAREKAIQLTAALDSKVGKVLAITEGGPMLAQVTPDQYNRMRRQEDNYEFAAGILYSGKGGSNAVNYEQIKISYVVSVKFAIE
jgi:uncharacterized protein